MLRALYVFALVLLVTQCGGCVSSTQELHIVSLVKMAPIAEASGLALVENSGGQVPLTFTVTHVSKDGDLSFFDDAKFSVEETIDQDDHMVIVCRNVDTGDIVWSKTFSEDIFPHTRMIILEKDLLIVDREHVTMLRKVDGQVIWSVPHGVDFYTYTDGLGLESLGSVIVASTEASIRLLNRSTGTMLCEVAIPHQLQGQMWAADRFESADGGRTLVVLVSARDNSCQVFLSVDLKEQRIVCQRTVLLAPYKGQRASDALAQGAHLLILKDEPIVLAWNPYRVWAVRMEDMRTIDIRINEGDLFQPSIVPIDHSGRMAIATSNKIQVLALDWNRRRAFVEAEASIRGVSGLRRIHSSGNMLVLSGDSGLYFLSSGER